MIKIKQEVKIISCSYDPSSQIQFLEKIVPLVADDDKCRKIFDLYAPDRFHAQVFEVDAFDFFDAVLGQSGAGAFPGGLTVRESFEAAQTPALPRLPTMAHHFNIQQGTQPSTGVGQAVLSVP